MAKLINTYGKTWHLWQVDRGDALPLGECLLKGLRTGGGEQKIDTIKHLLTESIHQPAITICRLSGPPMLMMALTAPGQLDEAQLAARDAALGVDSGANANARQGLQADPPEPHPLADHPWHTGRSWQTVMQQVEFRRAVSVATTAPGTAAGPAKAYMRC